MSAVEINLSLPEFSQEEQVQMWQESRAMFVARIENLGKEAAHQQTVQIALAILDDCDMLAQQSLLRTRA